MRRKRQSARRRRSQQVTGGHDGKPGHDGPGYPEPPASRADERQTGQKARRRRREQHADGDRAGPEGQCGKEWEDEVIGRGEEHHYPEAEGDGQDKPRTPDEREPVAGVADNEG